MKCHHQIEYYVSGRAGSALLGCYLITEIRILKCRHICLYSLPENVLGENVVASTFSTGNTFGRVCGSATIKLPSNSLFSVCLFPLSHTFLLSSMACAGRPKYKCQKFTTILTRFLKISGKNEPYS